jgi:hypothetical protein
MKNRLLPSGVLGLIFMVCVPQAFAWELNINPVFIARGFAEANVLLPVSNHWQIGPTLAYADMRIKTDTPNTKADTLAISYGIRAERDWSKNNDNGFYGAVQLDYAQLKLDVRQTDCQGVSAISSRAAAGYSWLLGSRIQIKTGAGLNSMFFSGGEFSCDDGSQEMISRLADGAISRVSAELSIGTRF